MPRQVRRSGKGPRQEPRGNSSAAVKSYNTSVNSFDRMVVPQGRKFAGLIQGDPETMPEPATLEESPRRSRYANDEDIRAAADN